MCVEVCAREGGHMSKVLLFVCVWEGGAVEVYVGEVLCNVSGVCVCVCVSYTIL